MSANMRINGLSGLDSGESSAQRLGWQVAQRVQYIVNAVAREKAGQPADQVAQELQSRLRRMGVVPNTRELSQYAEKISTLQNGGTA